MNNNSSTCKYTEFYKGGIFALDCNVSTSDIKCTVFELIQIASIRKPCRTEYFFLAFIYDTIN